MLKKVMVLSVLSLVITGMVFAGVTYKDSDKKGAEEMTNACVKFYNAATDKEAALKTIQDNKDGKWMKGDLYIFIIDMKGVMIDHIATPKLCGKDLSKLKDTHDKLFVNEMIETVTKKGEGWVYYYWPDPTTKLIAPKASFVKGLADKKYFAGVGVYGKED